MVSRRVQTSRENPHTPSTRPISKREIQKRKSGSRGVLVSRPGGGPNSPHPSSGPPLSFQFLLRSRRGRVPTGTPIEVPPRELNRETIFERKASPIVASAILRPQLCDRSSSTVNRKEEHTCQKKDSSSLTSFHELPRFAEGFVSSRTALDLKKET